MLRLNAVSPWLFAWLLCVSAAASAQAPTRPGVGDAPGTDGSATAPVAPIADPQRSPANILEDGPRDVGTKIDPTVCSSRPLPDDVMVQCRRWLLIASTPAYATTPQGNLNSLSYPQTARA
jgi:hypothetical protein